MNAIMMQQPLLISTLLTHAERNHGDQEIVLRRVEGDVHRQTYSDLAQRSRRMANALAAKGVRFGDRVATLAWNGYRHMELYYAVSGSGAVLHTLNPRLHPDQVVWIADIRRGPSSSSTLLSCRWSRRSPRALKPSRHSLQ